MKREIRSSLGQIMQKQFNREKAVFLIDGSSFLYRAYYALRQLHTSKGISVNAVYGFCRMIKKVINTFAPQNMILIWDSKGKTQRHEIYEAYKATRQAPPNDLFEQKEYIKKFADLIGFKQLEQAGVEADDLIYSAADDLQKTGHDVIIISSDKDLYQLLSNHIFIFDPFKEEIIDKTSYEEKLGYPIYKLPFYFALLGDASDNIPGVKGIGKKGAEDLVKQFESLEDLYEHIDRVKRESTAKALIENKDNAFLSYQLFLLRYTPVQLDLESIKFDSINWEKARPLFQALEFGSLLKEMGELPEETKKHFFAQEKGYTFELVTTKPQLDALVVYLQEKKLFALDTETTGLDPLECDLVGISFCAEKGRAYYIPVGHILKDVQQQIDTILPTEQQLSRYEVLVALKPLLEDAHYRKIFHHTKFDELVLSQYDINVQGVVFDTLIAANLVTKDWQRIGLDKLSLFYLDERMLDYDEVVKQNKLKNFAQVPLNLARDYAAGDAHQTFALKPILEHELEKKGMTNLFTAIEMPLAQVLLAMEKEGIFVDVSILQGLDSQISEKLAELENAINDLLGHAEPVNLNSPKQIEDILFNKLKLPPKKLSAKKTGYSTDQEVLEALSLLHPVPGLILRYRELYKLKSTYVDALPTYINKKTGKIHSSFSQTATATGRLASSNPNLQNIPADITSSFTSLLRTAFKPMEGNVFISADYSQIELRVLAYLSQDKNLIDAFLARQDIHALTASRLFDVAPDKVTHEQRQVGKRINFSILYGLTPYGLSQDLDIPFKEAKHYIEKYFAQYPQVQTWMEQTVQFAKDHGYVQTFWGRRRYIPGIHERNKALYEFARRAAINTVAQGTAAEIMKLGMINLHKAIREQELDAKILVQIHDELLIETPIEQQKITVNLVKSVLEGVVSWNIPLEVSTAIGNNWLKVS